MTDNKSTRFLMISSALIMGLTGFILLFMPDEVLSYSGFSSTEFSLVLQISGSLYIAFAVLNWMAKGNLIGGIYSRPVAMGNFAHFFIAGITLMKEAFAAQNSAVLWIAGIIYSVFAVLFALTAFRDPAGLK